MEHKQLYQSEHDWENQFEAKYTSLILELRTMLRKQDTLVIATMHEVREINVWPLNKRAVHVACNLSIPVFNQTAILGHDVTKYLSDKYHQNTAASRSLAYKLLAHQYTVPTECTSTKL